MGEFRTGERRKEEKGVEYEIGSLVKFLHRECKATLNRDMVNLFFGL